MELKDILWTASIVIAKNMQYEDLYYSDYMNGEEDETEAVWGYVGECEEIGTTAFYKKYHEFKLY